MGLLAPPYPTYRLIIDAGTRLRKTERIRSENSSTNQSNCMVNRIIFIERILRRCNLPNLPISTENSSETKYKRQRNFHRQQLAHFQTLQCLASPLSPFKEPRV